MLEPGDIIIVAGGRTFLDKLIYWASSTRKQECLYSHTEIAAGERVNEILNTDWDLTFGALALVKLSYWKPMPRYRIYGWKSPNDQDTAAQVLDAMIPELDGKLYGIQQYFFFGWRKLCNSLHLPKHWAIHQWFNGDYICTTVVNTLIRRVTERIGVQADYPYGKGALTPLDIVNICEQLVAKGVMVKKEDVGS